MANQDVNSLRNSIAECEAMLRYARSNGRKVKPEMQSTLEKLKIKLAQMEKEGMSNQTVADYTGKSGRRALGDISPEEMVNMLGEAHADLAKSIHPALPSAVMVLDEGQHSALRFLGPVPLVRRMMIITVVCLIGFLSLFLSPLVDSKTVATDILSMKDWTQFALNETVIVFAAALGACFYALFEAYKYVANASYDPRYESIYWIRFTLGIVSGVILAQFIFQPAMDVETLYALQEKAAQAALNDPTLTVPGPNSNNGAGTPNLQGLFTYSPLLAFLGGFSARVVHKILNSLVDSVESFISGSARDLIKAREESAKVQLEDKLNTMKQEMAAKESNNKVLNAIQLLKLQQQLNAGMSNDQIKSQLDSMVDNLVVSTGAEPIFGGASGVNTYTPPQPQPQDQPVVNNTATTDHGFSGLDNPVTEDHVDVTGHDVAMDILNDIPSTGDSLMPEVEIPAVQNPPVVETPPTTEFVPPTSEFVPPTTEIAPPPADDKKNNNNSSLDNPFADLK